MKHICFIILNCLIIYTSCQCDCTRQSCKQTNSENARKTDTTQFCYDINGRMITNVYISGKKYCAIFDTANDLIHFDIDSFPELRDSTCEHPLNVTNQWTGKTGIGYRVNKPIDIILPSNDTLHYKSYGLIHMGSYDFPNVRIYLSIPEDEKRVLNIDYEKRHLRILDKVPQNVVDSCSLNSPIELSGRDLSITIPLSFVFGNDTMNVEMDGLIDTGSPNEISFIGGDIDICANKELVHRLKEHSIATDSKNGYYLAHEVNVLKDTFVFKNSKSGFNICSNIWGNNMLCRYNLYLDLKDKKAYGVAIDEINKTYDINRMAAMFSGDRAVVYHVGEKSYFGKHGVRVGDCILSCDNKSMLEIPFGYFKGRVATLEIMRDGQVIEIQVTDDIQE